MPAKPKRLKCVYCSREIEDLIERDYIPGKGDYHWWCLKDEKEARQRAIDNAERFVEEWDDD